MSYGAAQKWADTIAAQRGDRWQVECDQCPYRSPVYASAREAWKRRAGHDLVHDKRSVVVTIHPDGTREHWSRISGLVEQPTLL